MLSRRVTRTTSAGFAAIGLSLVLAGHVAAASWRAPITIDTGAGFSSPYSSELAALGGSVAVVGYGMSNQADIDHVLVRRTTDGGGTWGTATLVTEHGWAPSTAGRGPNVDVVWLWNGRVNYARSQDAARSFGNVVTLSRPHAHANRPRVARGPNGLVAVVWDEAGSVNATISTNGGASFGAVETIASRGFFPVVAVGKGVIYVLFAGGDYDDVRVIRSVDDGATWGGRMIAGPDEGVEYSITADGTSAYIGYEATSNETYWALDYRGTSDRGTTWSQPRSLLPASWNGYNPLVSLSGGILRAVFVPCHDSGDSCDDSGRIFYEQSADGRTWTQPVRVSPKSLYAVPTGVGFAGNVIATYEANATPSYVPVLFSRAGSE